MDPSTPLWRRRPAWASYLGYLDSLEIQQFADYSGVCRKCSCPYYGILDESKLTLPMGADTTASMRTKTIKFLGMGYHSRIVLPSQGRTVPVLTEGMGDYEIRQRIVNSGVFTREQLSGAAFTQHELEVSEKQFSAIRPKRCDCDFGSEPDFDMPVEEAIENMDVYTHAETDFMSGKPVRTGFRRRSPSARRRRRRSRSSSPNRDDPKPIVGFVCIPKVHPMAKGHKLGNVFPVEVTIHFKYTPESVGHRKRYHRRHNARRRRRRSLRNVHS
jgi:hypothetical protein